MKKLLFLMFAVFLLTSPLILLADTGDPPNPISLDIFTSTSALIAGVVALTALIKNTFGTTGTVTDIISWVIGPLIALVGFFLQLGIFVGLSWYMALLYGLFAAFAANKGWDIFKLFVKSK